MWYLTEVKDSSNNCRQGPCPRHWLGGIAGNGRTIGRKHVDIRLKASSVSRTHAQVNVFKAAFYSPTAVPGRRRHQSTSVTVKDSSAYGTFLKYPPGHTSNRTEVAAGHHRRLDKDTPTEISEGALLAFGAPSAWWLLGWENIVVLGSRLSDEERARLVHVSQSTSLECVETWGHDVTHFVTSQCVCSSMKFITALVDRKHIVTMAWVEAVRHTVAEACRAITDAANPEAALSACALADEKRFVPSFSPGDQATYGAEVLGVAFDDSIREKRSSLFNGITFAFVREELRAKWSSSIETLGGKSMLAQAVGGTSQGHRIVFVQSDRFLPKRTHEPSFLVGRACIQESALISSILGADLSCLDETSEPVQAAVPELTDVATPGPLDESDADTENDNDSDAGDTVTQDDTRQAVTGDLDIGGVPVDVDQARRPEQMGAAKKRARVHMDSPRAATIAKEVSRPQEKGLDTNRRLSVGDGQGEVDNEDANERVFFIIDEVEPAKKAKKLIGSSSDRGTSSRDVRLFQRRKLPSSSVIPLKKVRHESVEPRRVVNAETKRREYSSAHGARVMESDEE